MALKVNISFNKVNEAFQKHSKKSEKAKSGKTEMCRSEKLNLWAPAAE